MQNKVNIGKSSKIVVKWNVSPMDYSREAEDNIISKMAIKYNVPKEHVKVEACFIQYDINGNIENYSNDIITNINEPTFQQNLFRQYIDEKNITECSIEKIIEIDNFINNSIDYDKYDKNKEYTIKWLKWSNFMSYGPDNFIDLSTLKGLVLLSSNPANQGGKSTFCIDLIRFLLFGKVTSRESDWTLSKVFNKHLPEATEVTVEGCISIDGVDYIIKRVVSRPALSKRTSKSKVSQKVNYYKLVNNELLDLVEEEDLEESSSVQTNKVIKEVIGNEKDFDLMICVNSDNLKGLISLKDTDRGRLLSRWIGLLPLEEKDKIARETYNHQIVPKLLLNRYNRVDLEFENENLAKENENYVKESTLNVEKLNNSKVRLENYKKERDKLFLSKQKIDETLLKVDVATIENKLQIVTDNGKAKKYEKECYIKKLNEFGEISFDENKYRELNELITSLSVKINTLKMVNKNTENEINGLKKGEFCPTCGAKLKDVDNTSKIVEKEQIIVANDKLIANYEKDLETIKEQRDKMEINRTAFNEKSRTELLIAKIEVDIDNLRKDYKEYVRILKEIDNNKAAIAENNNIQNKINIIDVNIRTEEGIIVNLQDTLNNLKYNIECNAKEIDKNKKIIETIINEEILVKNWKVYLDLVGKNGITKIVLRNTLPIINAELSKLLNDVCDFTLEVIIDERQDVSFKLIHDGVKSELASGSGFEQTVSSLALRSVLSKISAFSKPSFVVFDEVLGGVSDENYDNVKKLYDKIINDYKTIFEITHLKAIHDWHEKSILITKKDNISSLSML